MDASERLEADLVIAGGGLIGPATALAAAHAGLRAVVVDKTPFETLMDDGFDGRAYAVALSSKRFFERLGLWPVLEPVAGPINDIMVSDGRPGEPASPMALHFDGAEMRGEGFGWMIEDRHIRQALLRAAGVEPLVTLINGVGMARFETDLGGVTAHLEDGRQLRAPLLVGADGRTGAVARAAGLAKIRVEYDQVGLVCAVRHEKPHCGVAHELFLPSGPFAILPLKDPHVSSLVWTERARLADAFRALDDAAYLGEVARRFGPFLGRLELAGKRWVYPLNLVMSDGLVAERVALAGDAVRGMHPIAGQGMNYGLRDVAALTEVLGDAARRGEDLGDLGVLRRYETARRADSALIAMATDGLNRLFSNDIAPVRLARRLGLKAFGAIGPLRRAAMRFAAGDSPFVSAQLRR